jgi:hypothetical protein
MTADTWKYYSSGNVVSSADYLPADADLKRDIL